MITLNEAINLTYKSHTIYETFGILVGTKPVTREVHFLGATTFVVKREFKLDTSYEIREMSHHGSSLVKLLGWTNNK